MKVQGREVLQVYMIAKLLYESSRWRCSRESMWDSVKVFREGLRVQLAVKLSWYTVYYRLLLKHFFKCINTQPSYQS